MKHLLYTLACCLLLAACSDSNDHAASSDDSADAVQASLGSSFPTVIKDAYAPWAKMEDEASYAIHPADAPKASEIDIPPFPESFIVSSGEMGEGPAALQYVVLICADAAEAVQDFYQRELVDKRGWSYSDQYHVFQEGEGDDFLVRAIPFVTVTKLNREGQDMQFVDDAFIKDFNTRIQITYR